MKFFFFVLRVLGFLGYVPEETKFESRRTDMFFAGADGKGDHPSVSVSFRPTTRLTFLGRWEEGEEGKSERHFYPHLAEKEESFDVFLHSTLPVQQLSAQSSLLQSFCDLFLHLVSLSISTTFFLSLQVCLQLCCSLIVVSSHHWFDPAIPKWFNLKPPLLRRCACSFFQTSNWLVAIILCKHLLCTDARLPTETQPVSSPSTDIFGYA